MSKAPFMPLFCDAYLGDTMHMSLEEHGAYLKLLMVTWRNNGVPLPDDDARLARILGVTTARWRSKLRPVLEPLFDVSGGVWRSARLEKEWNFVQKNAAVSRENGKRGGRPKSLKENDTENPAGSLQGTQSETTHTQPNNHSDANASSADAAQSGGGDDDKPVDLKARIFGGAREWLIERGGVTDAKARKVLGQWCRDHGDGATLEALQNAARASPEEPISWITGVLNGTAGKRFGQPFSSVELLGDMADDERSRWTGAADYHDPAYHALPRA